MKSTENFKRVIEKHLNDVATNDPLFAKTLAKENKNIDQCILYILSEVQKSGCNAFDDDEIFGMAIHYYDEDEIEVKKTSFSNMKIVSNHQVELTQEEIEQAKREALNRVVVEEQNRLRTKTTTPKKTEVIENPTLFDL